MATVNQRKAHDLIDMLRSQGVETMAGELEEIVAEAFIEGVELSGGERHGQLNPYVR